MSSPSCPDCIHSAMVDATLICSWFNVKASPTTAIDCAQFERCAGADGKESAAHRVWYADAPGRGD